MEVAPRGSGQPVQRTVHVTDHARVVRIEDADQSRYGYGIPMGEDLLRQSVKEAVLAAPLLLRGLPRRDSPQLNRKAR